MDGIIYLVPGISGGIVGTWLQKRALIKAGCPYAVEIYDWSRGALRFVGDITDVEGNREKARALARMIETWLDAHPGGRVQVLGVSGGAAVATWAVEELRPDVTIDRLMLSAPALSPGYDLTRALRHVDREAVVFVSRNDLVLLGIGTWLFGALDRVKGFAAGKVGFALPGNADDETRRLYAKIRRIDWIPEMLREGNYGGHLGWSSPLFVRNRLVPMLVGD